MRIWGVFLVALGGWLAWSPAVRAEAFAPEGDDWEGLSELVKLAQDELGESRVVVSPGLNWSELQAEDALLILHPETEISFRQLGAFLAVGGRAALVDDHGTGAATLSRFHLYRQEAPSWPAQRLRDNPALAIAKPAEDTDTGSRHPIVRDVEQVVSNHPTGLRPRPGLELTPILQFEVDDADPVYLAVVGVIGDASRCGLVDEQSPSEPTPCGRLFAMGDPSAFINLMLRYPGNRALAKGLIEYLVEDDSWGGRQGRLFILSNRISEAGHFAGTSSARAALRNAVSSAASLLADVRRDGLPRFLALLLGVLGLCGSAYGMLKFTAGVRRPRGPRFARPTPLVAQSGPVGRAAVLASRTTHPALVVLELKMALEAVLRSRLKLEKTASTSAILEEIDRQQLLAQPSLRRLEQLISEMNLAEAAVATSERIRLRPGDVERIHQEVSHILTQLDEGTA